MLGRLFAVGADLAREPPACSEKGYRIVTNVGEGRARPCRTSTSTCSAADP